MDPTSGNYLARDRMEPNPKLGSDEEAMLPPQFRLRPLQKAPLCLFIQRIACPFCEPSEVSSGPHGAFRKDVPFICSKPLLKRGVEAKDSEIADGRINAARIPDLGVAA